MTDAWLLVLGSPMWKISTWRESWQASCFLVIMGVQNTEQTLAAFLLVPVPFEIYLMFFEAAAADADAAVWRHGLVF